MHIIGIEGSYGSGKTTTAVLKALQWSFKTGATLFANFEMKGAYLFDHYEDWYRVAAAHGSILIFDEAVKNYDSRRYGQQGQIEMTHVMNYVRKMNCLMIFILPDYNDLESRVRNKTDILIYCKKDKGRNIHNIIYDRSLREYDRDRGKKINQWVLPLRSQKLIWKEKLFNTHSMVHQFPTPPAELKDEFYRKLDYYHRQALQKKYGHDYIRIEYLKKPELEMIQDEQEELEVIKWTRSR